MKVPQRCLIGLWLVFMVIGASGTRAEDVEFRGFYLGMASLRTTGERPVVSDSDFMLGRNLLRLDLEGWADSVDASFQVRVDVVHDSLTGDVFLDVREAFVDYSVGPLDFRLGRQIVTWGVGDLIFINDVFPKDWTAFFTGQPLEYLKRGVDGLRVRYTGKPVNIELMVVPFFEPDRLPAYDNFVFFDPLAAFTRRMTREPSSRLSNLEIAGRLYRNLAGADLSIYAYRGFWRQPGVLTPQLLETADLVFIFPRLNVFGASLQRAMLKGVVSAEVGYYDSEDDRDGVDPGVPNSQWRFLVGYQRQIGDNTTVGIQYYAEVMADFDAYRRTLMPGMPVTPEYRDWITFRFDRMFAHQTWLWSLFVYYGPKESDYYAIASLTRKVSDELSVTLGMNLFGGGNDTTFFGRFDRDDNLFFRVNYQF